MVNSDLDPIRSLEKLSLTEAKEVVKSWMIKPKSKNGLFKYNNLMLDIDRAPSMKSLITTTWNIVLAGDGLSVPNSQWQKDHAKHLYT